MVAALPYLSSDQPCPLQELCCRCFQELMAVNADIVWLVLQQMVPPTLTTPTNPALKPFKFPTNPDSAKYITNITPLLSMTFKCV